MNRRFPRVTRVDLSGTTKNLSYDDNMNYEAIGEDLVEDEAICKAQPHIIEGCENKNQEIEDDENKNDNENDHGEE